MVALAREVVAADAALSSVPSSTLSQGTLAKGAAQVEYFARALLLLLARAELSEQQAAGATREDTFFVYRVLSASAVILGSASRACASERCEPADLESHTLALRQLLQALAALGEGQASTLRVLRATTCSPEAVVACVRRLFVGQLRTTAQGERGVQCSRGCR